MAEDTGEVGIRWHGGRWGLDGTWQEGGGLVAKGTGGGG
jgi:hypothetical protein